MRGPAGDTHTDCDPEACSTSASGRNDLVLAFRGVEAGLL